MVKQFGSVVEVNRHCGWTGNMETSWKTMPMTPSSNNQTTNLVKDFSFIQLESNTNASKTLREIDGDDSILYWVDYTSEIAFYLPQKFSSRFGICALMFRQRIFSSG